MNTRPPLPPFTEETARQKVQLAEDECLPCVPHELELAANGLMPRRFASINDVLITEADREFRLEWPS